MNVLSLFDGMSCGRIALDRAGLPVTNYYASEIDKYAIQVSKANWPDIEHVGDVTKLESWYFPKIDLLIGGSPCQGFSFAGKQLNFSDPRSKLFFEFVRLLKQQRERNPKIKFLLENVVMKKEYQDVISEALGVKPVLINSALVSAQNRKRLYWTNIPFLGQPDDKGILLKDILETGGAGFIINRNERNERNDKAMCIDANYHKGADNHGQRTLIDDCLMSDVRIAGYKRRQSQNGFPFTVADPEGKSPTFVGCTGGHHTPKVQISPASIIGRRLNEKGKRDDYNSGVPITQCLQVKHCADKTGCLTTVDKDNVVTSMPPGRYEDVYNKPEITYRKLTVIECARLQCVPDRYTGAVSNTQAYKMLGNGWNVDTIVHLFQGLKCDWF